MATRIDCVWYSDRRCRFTNRFAMAILAVVAVTRNTSAQWNPIPLSVPPSKSLSTNDWAFDPALSGDGKCAAFASASTDLVPGDTNQMTDVFVKNLTDGTVARVSVASDGTEGDGPSIHPALSHDGRYVAFDSAATNLVPGDNNLYTSYYGGGWDVFVHDRDPDGNGVFDEGNGLTTRVSVTSGGTEQHEGQIGNPCISGDGRRVCFLGDVWLDGNWSDGTGTIFVRDRDPDGNGVFDEGNDTTTVASVDLGQFDVYGASASISADGRFVAFDAYTYVGPQADGRISLHVFVRDLVTRTTRLASVNSRGDFADNYCFSPRISANGDVVAFQSSATNLVAGDTNASTDVFVHDMKSGITERVNVGANGRQSSGTPYGIAISADGRFVSFATDASDLDPVDTNGWYDVYLHDRMTAETKALSRGPTGVIGDEASFQVAMSDDGKRVAFFSAASNLTAHEDGPIWAVYLFDQDAPPAPRARWCNYGAGFPGTLGTPNFVSRAPPRAPSTLAIDAENSLGAWTPGLLVTGFLRASIPTSAGGTLLTVPAALTVEAIAPGGLTQWISIPDDMRLLGWTLDLQLLEADPGAEFGLSFTCGLELEIGS